MRLEGFYIVPESPVSLNAASLPSVFARRDVDGRDKPDHDEVGRWVRAMPVRKMKALLLSFI
jgi:hypothetical protein